MKKFFLPALLAASTLLPVHAATPLWLRDASISPDGSVIAFTYRGDIYTVPASGGTASRLTSLPSYESMPVWSPDGKEIAFASDREGGNDIFIMSAAGGEARRLTSNSAEEFPTAFTPDGASVVYTAAIQSPAASLTFPSPRYTQLYSVPVSGGRATQILGTPAKSISYMKDGKSFLYQDIKGVEDEWRKHHTSSVTRDIVSYDPSTGRHVNLTARQGEDTNPVMGGDGETVYFLSERDGGSFNVYSFPLSDPSKVTRLTDFTRHPVRFLSRSGNGTLAFTYDGELYTMNERGGTPSKVSVDIVTDLDETPLHRRFSSGAEEAVPSPDGNQVAFASRGDIFVTSAGYPTTKQITTTPQNESSPTWGDNRTLYYASDRDGVSNIYRARISRKDDPNFPNATIIEETALFPADGIDRRNPLVSPNGQMIAFIQDRRKIAVMDLTTRKVKPLTQGETYTARDGEIELDWAPDSEWLAATIDVHQRDPYYDIAIFNVATGEMTNITNDAYINCRPRWVMGGDAIVFISERYGMKNHASWGSTYDVLLAFTNREAYDRFRLSEEDFALLKEVEKEQKKKKDEPKKDDGKKKGKKKDAGKDEPAADAPEDMVKVETDGIRDRIVRLTPFSSDLSDAWIDPDGENLYFLSTVEDGEDLWKMDLRKEDVSIDKKLGGSHLSLQPDATGKLLFILGPKMMKKYTVASGKTDNVSYSATQKIDPEAEREYLFDYMVKEEKERFLVEDMFGADWDGLSEDYRKFLPHISNNYDFAELASELLGELNVSHTGCRYYPDGGASEPTASLGLLYDMTYSGPGLRVAEVVAKGPFDRASSRIVPGAVITAIDGVSLDGLSEPLSALNARRGRKTLVSFTLPDGAKVDEVVLPIAAGAMNELLYNRWVERNRALVDSLSGGRLGYVHLRSMSDPSYRTVYADVLGRYADRDGIVIDTRFNGGGRLHEDIEVLFSGKKYLTQEIRGVKSGEMPSRRWLRPSVMVTGEYNYSNAHGTPWMYKHLGLGKLVGMPVPGTMSSVNWITMQDPSLVFGVPVVGFRTAEGNLLENTQLEPDVKVANDPADIVRGVDSQLATAVRTLLSDIDK